jgi:hypothetical protein
MSTSKQATVAAASPSPPPLPNEPLPFTSVTADEPITSLGDDDDDDENDENEEDDEEASDAEWDPAEERLPGDDVKGKGKRKASAEPEEGVASIGQDQPWQAVWSPEKNG